MVEKTIVIHHPVGLHARPAALFVKTAQKFNAVVKVQNLTNGNGPADAKSILAVLTLGVAQNHELQLTGEGDDAEEAVLALIELIADDFGEH